MNLALLNRRRFLQVAFGLALTVTLLLAARFVARFLYFRRHADEPVAGWMPLGYVARSHGVPVEALRDELGLAPEFHDRRPIEQIASESGMPPEAYIAEVEAALERLAGTPAGGADP